MANLEAASIRNQAQEALNLHCDGQHEDALARAVELAAAHPGSALALNLAGLLHRRAALVALNDMVPGDDDDDASALEPYHRHAALDAFSAAARLAPDCVLTGGDHAQALADCDRYEDAQKEFLRVLNTAESNNYADPALHNVVFDMSGVSSGKERRRAAAKGVNLAMERFAANVNNKFLPLEAVKLLDANDLGGPAADGVRDRAKLLAHTYPYSARAQLLRAYIELAPVRALDTAAMEMDKKRFLLRHALLIVSEAAETFDCSLLSALFHAKLLFVLDRFDAAEAECRRALRIEAPTDPNWDDIPPMAALGADPDARVSYVKKQLRVLLKQIIVVPALYWSSMKSPEQRTRVLSVMVDTLHAHYDGIDKSAAKTISDARRFLKNQDSWNFWICLNAGCAGKKFVDTGSLWQHMRSKHRDALWGKLQSVIDPEHCENTSQDDHWLDGITLRRQPDTFLLPRVQDMFESLLLSPSIGIQAEPFAEMRQRKCRQGSEILDSIREKLRMLPQDTLSTEFQDCTSGIANLWLNFLEITLVDYREVILPLARSFQWTELKNRIPFYLNHPGSRRVEFADANIDIICGTSGQSVKEEMASTSSCQQSLNVFNKNNADNELSILSVIIRSLGNLRHFRDKFLTEPLVWIPSVENPCIAQQFYEIFSTWEKNNHHLTDAVLSYMKTLLCEVLGCSNFSEKSYMIMHTIMCLHNGNPGFLVNQFQFQVGKTFASEIVSTILIELHMSETCSRFRLNKETERHVVNPITCGDCICPTHDLFGIKFDAQISCSCEKSSGEYLYTTLFHKLDAGSPQTTKIKSFAELPVLLDEQFCEDNKCEHCGSLQNIDLFLSNTPHFFTIVLNWLGGSESQDTLSEILAGITSPIDTEFFCRSAHSAAIYTVTSMICYADDRYVFFARDEDTWVIYGFETVVREDSWEHLLERFKDCKLQPEVLFFEVIK